MHVRACVCMHAWLRVCSSVCRCRLWVVAVSRTIRCAHICHRLEGREGCYIEMVHHKICTVIAGPFSWRGPSLPLSSRLSEFLPPFTGCEWVDSVGVSGIWLVGRSHREADGVGGCRGQQGGAACWVIQPHLAPLLSSIVSLSLCLSWMCLVIACFPILWS